MTRKKRQRCFPHVPLELISRIMCFVLYDDGHFSPYMQAEDLSGLHQASTTRHMQFLSSFLPVSREINRAALTHVWRSLTVYRAEELDDILTAMQAGSTLFPDIDLGGLCRRIELRLTGSYDRAKLLDILDHTPNIRIFIFSNTWAHIPSVPPRLRLDNIVEALASKATQLTRLQLQAAGEEPTAAHALRLLEAMPHLVTLHVDKFAESFGAPADQPYLECICPQLETISIGNARRQGTRPILASTTDDVLPSLAPTFLLPKLNTVYVQRFTPSIRQFIDRYADRIQELGFCSEHAWAAGTWNNEEGGHLVGSCPNLSSIVCVVVERPNTPPVYSIPSHPHVEKLVVVYAGRRTHTNMSIMGDAFTRLAVTLPDMCAGREVVVLTSSVVEPIESTRWFRMCRRRARKEGVTLREMRV